MSDTTEKGSLSGSERLRSGLKELFRTGDYSDFTIACKDREWHVHKAVICLQSDFFLKACKPGFKEDQDKAITLSEDDPDVVNAMLDFMYTSDYSDYSDAVPGDESHVLPMSFNIHVFTAADKYDMPALSRVAAAKFKTLAETKWATSEFIDIITDVYDCARADRNSIMRQIVVSVSQAHA